MRGPDRDARLADHPRRADNLVAEQHSRSAHAARPQVAGKVRPCHSLCWASVRRFVLQRALGASAFVVHLSFRSSGRSTRFATVGRYHHKAATKSSLASTKSCDMAKFRMYVRSLRAPVHSVHYRVLTSESHVTTLGWIVQLIQPMLACRCRCRCRCRGGDEHRIERREYREGMRRHGTAADGTADSIRAMSRLTAGRRTGHESSNAVADDSPVGGLC